MKAYAPRLSLIAMIFGLVCRPTVSAAEVSYHPISNDADSEISSNKTYTHAIDFGNPGGDATVNGVVFAADVNVAAGGRSNPGTRTYGPNPHGGGPPPAVSGGIAGVFRDMRYNGPDQAYVELTGLTSGVKYDLRLYDRAWDYEGVFRTFHVGYDIGSDGLVEFTTPKIDQNRGALVPPGLSGNVSWAMSYVYRADSSGKIKVIIDLADGNTGSYHLYGLTNEEFPPEGPIYWDDSGASNITTTSASVFATVNTNLDDATLVWDTSDQGDGDTNAWAKSLGLGPQSAGTMMGVATGLQADTLYTWRFYGENGANSAWSAAATFATDLTAAQTPTFTSQNSSWVSVTLEWQDNADTETGYVLRRSDSGSGGPYAVVATLDGNVTKHEDKGLVSGTTYFYQLAATNDVNGSGTAFSACVTSATTPELPPLKGELDIWKPWANEGINPATGLPWAPGDTYRLVFVSSVPVRDATSTNMVDYHAAITAFANNAGLGGDWFVIGMTDGTTGQENTQTTESPGVGIFQTDGATKVADSYIDFWDGSLDNPMSRDETGALQGPLSAAVGGYANGQPENSGGRHLGGSTETPPKIHYGRSTDTGGYWARVFNGPAADQWRFYGMSDVLTVESTSTPGKGFSLQVR